MVIDWRTTKSVWFNLRKKEFWCSFDELSTYWVLYYIWKVEVIRDVGVEEKYGGKKRERCSMKFILIGEVKRGPLAADPSLRSRPLVILDGPATGRRAQRIEHPRSRM